MGAYDSGSGATIRITATTAALLETLKKNRESHQENYDEALIKWQSELEFCQEVIVSAIRESNEPKSTEDFASWLKKQNNAMRELVDSKPVEFLEEYDTAIEMLSWHEGESFQLERHQFECFVQDKWDWKRSFETHTLKYIRKKN